MPRRFLYTLVGVNVALGIAGALLAARGGLTAATTMPVIAALLLQVSFCIVPGFPKVRRLLEKELRPASLGLVALGSALLPYLVYSLPTGVFRFTAFLELSAIAVVPAFVFVLWPVRSQGVTWQDLVVLGTFAIVLGSKALRTIYLALPELPDPRIPWLVGRIMIAGLAATAFLSLRRVRRSGFRFSVSGSEAWLGIKNFVFFVPVGAAIGIVLHAIPLQPVYAEPRQYLLLLPTGLLVWAPCLFDELLFRGVLQNLLAKTMQNPLKAQAAASLAFGFSRITLRTFPDWDAVILTTILGWFCGQAYRDGRSVVASSITQTLAATLLRAVA